MHAAHRQGDHQVRFDWGLAGAATVAEDADVVVVVDVLSFTTTLTVALDVGMVVFPYPAHDDAAERFAREVGAVLAVERSRSGPGQLSVSPVRERTGARRAGVPRRRGDRGGDRGQRTGACAGRR